MKVPRGQTYRTVQRVYRWRIGGALSVFVVVVLGDVRL
jgi:hypothetical protein